MSKDYTLTEGEDGRPVLHRPDCAVVIQQREEGRPLFTMFECEGDPPDDIELHSCLHNGAQV